MRLLLLQPVLHAFDPRHNLTAIEQLVANQGTLYPDDIILLPEHFTSSGSIEAYTEFLKHLATIAGCTIVGGSHHREVHGKRLNAGTIVGPGGSELGRYSKVRPYFHELNHITPGDKPGEFFINGKHLLVLICADFWYSDLILQSAFMPDLILVPALSVSRKPSPDYARSLWKHLAITRAYELGVYIGISDWNEGSALPKYRTSGVGGFADPTQTDPERLFTPIDESGSMLVSIDFEALERFRADRRMRGFFWK